MDKYNRGRLSSPFIIRRDFMEFDRESEFERLMGEVMPLSIPTSYIREVVVTLKNGGTISLSGEELLKPLPMMGSLSWDGISNQHDSIEDIDVLINVPLIQENVVMNVRNLLAPHFGSDKLDNKED